MTSIASAIAGHRLVAFMVGLVIAVLALGTGFVLFEPGGDRPSDTLAGLVFVVGGSLSFTLVGATILVRRPGHRIGRLMIAMGVTLALAQAVPVIIGALAPALVRPGSIGESIQAAAADAGMIAIVLGAALLVVWFPDGRTSSRFGTMGQAIVAALAIIQFVGIVNPSLLGQSELGFLLIIGAYAMALIDLVVRHGRSDTVRRTQIRWVLASGSISTALVVGILAFGDQIEWLWQAWLLSTILPAIAVGIAITRYHLYEIDRIISRTLTYAGVTVGLFGVFGAANLVAQWVLSPFTNGNAVAVAGSTLLAAAAFDPLRTRFQTIVDRRFNRGRYDAERTIDAFAGRLRDELDLATLAAALQRTTRVTVEPASTAVWLRGGAPR